ncbi:MAG TPA: cell division protein ZapE [Longimicrobium sp.]
MTPVPVLSLDALLRTLPPRPEAGELLAAFVPPPRFAGKGFEDYRPDPRHPSQEAAVDRLRAIATELGGGARMGWRGLFRGARTGSGVYLDGGFGVGKTHLMAALWNSAGEARSYLSFDELMYTIGLLGVEGTRELFSGQRLVCVDEWELDDPGNLRMAIAFLRGALADGVRVAATSNTVPDELGRGRFPQKSFAAEIEELASAFETLRVEGEDFRHRLFRADPGRELFLDDAAMEAAARAATPRTLRAGFAELLAALGEVHPIRYAALADSLDGLLVDGMAPIASMAEGLRWVHFVDKVYDDALPMAATSSVGLGGIFPSDYVAGPFGKKFSRCLSRMEEMLGS